MTTLLTMKGFNKQVQPITTAWIYHNPDLWLISLSSDGSTWITIADKNLGATQVYEDGDTMSEANCWKFYQRWNNYGFPFTWAVTTSSTRVNASTYWPWNYYNSSTFIIGSNSWDNSNNTDLWWWDTWTATAMQWPCQSNYHVPDKDELDWLKDIMTALSIDTSNWNCMKTYLKMPFAGKRGYSNSNIVSQDVEWLYWSTIAYSTLAYGLDWTSSSFSQPWYRRAEWLTLRPFANTPVQPDDSRTVLYPTN